MLLDDLSSKSFTVRTLVKCGMFAPTRPDKLALTLRALRRWGPSAAAGYSTSAIRYPDRVALIDELGSLTFVEMQRRTNALAHAWSDEGIGAGDVVAILCRNHRGLVEALVACSKLGAHALFLNTAFSSRQLQEVCALERPMAIVHDEEFAGVIAAAGAGRTCYVAGSDRAARASTTLDALIERGDPSEVVAPADKGRIIILTSGTTGTPKGANRTHPTTLAPVAALLSKIPLRARERTLIAAPLFHSWGLAHLLIAIGLSSTVILCRRFDAEQTLRAIDEHGVTALVVVPVMLAKRDPRARAGGRAPLRQRFAARDRGQRLDAAGRARHAGHGYVRRRALQPLRIDRGPAWATIATPCDLRAAPGTAGRPPRGTVVRLLDAADRDVAAGRTGRIFVGNELVFDGYTGGGGKTVVDGLVSSGDLGRFDAAGRLFVEGREDEMIISGGENVFPREVEDAIAELEGVREVAAIGVADGDFGQRLRAFVVRRNGATLTDADVKQHVKLNLARFKVPRDVVFLDELPRNATGKVLKRELAKLP